jgi:hypothetical protein
MAGGNDHLVMGESQKLSGVANYTVWKFRIRNVLQKEGLWKIVVPTSGQLVAVADQLAREGAGATAGHPTAEETALARSRQRALAILCLAVGDEVIPHIGEEQDPAEVWKIIKALYETGGNARRLLLKSKIQNLKLDEGGSVAEFLKEVRNISNQLIAIGETMPDSMIVEHILNALPESYENFVTSIGLRDQFPNLTSLTGLLLHDEARRELRSNKRITAEAHYVKGRNPRSKEVARSSSRGVQETHRPRANSRRGSGGHHHHNNSPKPECHWCGSNGHYMRDCPGLTKELSRRALERKKKIGSNTANAVINSSGSSEDFVEAAHESLDEEDSDRDQIIEANVVSIKDENEWYVDSGVSKHVTGSSGKLKGLTTRGRGSAIEIANGKSYPIVGTGEYSHNDAIKFEKVLYVPRMTRNLLSVGKIADKRLGIYFDST